MRGTRHVEPVQRKREAAPLRRRPSGEAVPPPSGGPQQAFDESARVLARVAQAKAVGARAERRADVAQRAASAAPTGGSSLPGDLQEGLESASGLSLDGVRVHYDAGEPAQLQALAYTRGDHIFLGPGQERHLPHEAWHAVQQRQGRVRPTTEVAGQAVNDAHALEREADVMGEQVLQRRAAAPRAGGTGPGAAADVVQRVFDTGRFTAALDGDEPRYAAGLAAQSTDGAELYQELSNLLALTPQDEVTERLRKLRTVYERSATPWAKIQLLRVWSSFDHLERTRASGIPMGRQPDVMGLYDDFLNSAELMALRHQRENSGLLAWYGKDDRSQRHRDEIRALDARMRRAQNLALTYQVGIRNRPFPHGASADQRLAHQRNFSDGELQNLESVLGRLPAAHVAQNDNLRLFQRADVAEDAEGAGAEYDPGDRGVHVYDLGFGGRYRAAGSVSALGEHPANAPLQGGEEVLAHEIGHSVEPLYPAASQALRAAAGWRAYTTLDEIRLDLRGDGLTVAEANQAIARLQATRERNYSQRATEAHNGHEYVVDPYSGGFLRRDLNRMPGDAQTPESIPGGGRSLVPYARSAPKEMFAELYSQMVHVPERVFENYVTRPGERAMAASGPAAMGNPADVAAYRERRAQAAALSRQWTVMREQVFGVTAQTGDAAVTSLDQWAAAHHVAPANRRQPILDFRRDFVRAATPHQVEVLAARARQEMTQLQNAAVVAPVGVGLAPYHGVAQQRAAPVVQRKIAATKDIGAGRLTVDFEPDEPKYLPRHAYERGHVTFVPGRDMEDTNEIQMEQLVRLDIAHAGLPDEHDLVLESQKTRGTKGADAGFVVDQVPEGLDRRIGRGDLTGALTTGRAHFYGESGEVNETGLLEILKAIDREDVRASDLDELARSRGVTVPRLALLRQWVKAQRSQGRLETLDAESLAEALAATARGDESVPAQELAAATGLDPTLLTAARSSGARSGPLDARTRQDVVGWKKGASRQAAVLYDTPGSRTPATYFFKTAPYDKQHESYLGGYAEWGFAVEPGPRGFARIKPGSEHVAIHDELWDDYTATAKQAQASFYRTWNRRQAERGFRAIGFDLYEKNGRYFVYQEGRSELKPLPEGTTRDDVRHLLPPPPPRPIGAFDASGSGAPLLPRAPHAEPRLGLPSREPEDRPSRLDARLAPAHRVTRYASGQIGAFFVTGPEGPIVVKPLHAVYNELVAHELGRAIGVSQPKTDAIRGDSGPGREYLAAILASSHAPEYERSFGRSAPPFFLLMSEVKGRTLEKARDEGVDDLPGSQDLSLFLRDFGLIAAYDIVLFYRDRTSAVGAGNLANLILEPGDRLRAVAIDQRVGVKTVGLLGTRPVEQIGEVASGLADGTGERLDFLWEDLPASIRERLGGDVKGREALRRSVLDGLQTVVERLDPRTTARIASGLERYKLPSAPQGGTSSSARLHAAADEVDVESLDAGVRAIASGLKARK